MSPPSLLPLELSQAAQQPLAGCCQDLLVGVQIVQAPCIRLLLRIPEPPRDASSCEPEESSLCKTEVGGCL